MALSPMMQQYFTIKEKYPDCLLFYRLGDFYEMFFEDAVTASKALDLFLTGRDCGLPERAPMCGVPFHAVDSYISKLIEQGFKVAICEQLELPQKGIAPREVVRVITPGTIMESDMLSPEKNNYLMSICLMNNKAGIAWTDISTGEFNKAFIDSQLSLHLNDLLLKINPSEIICNGEMKTFSENLSSVKYNNVASLQELGTEYYDLADSKVMIKKVFSDSSDFNNDYLECVIATGALLKYITYTQKKDLKYIKSEHDDERCMIIDSTAVKTLELLTTQDGKKYGSLYSILNKTQTGMGARLLGKYLVSPSLDTNTINMRLDGIEELTQSSQLRSDINDYLKNISDMERLCARLAYGNINPKELLLLGQSCAMIPHLRSILDGLNSSILIEIKNGLRDLSCVEKLIFSSVNENPPAVIRDGGVIKSGYSHELDEERSISSNSKLLLANIEKNEKERTGIKNLRIGYTSVFGYFIEVSKGQLDLVPPEYIRKQTLTNGERFITDELKILESKILHAEENAVSLEQKLYAELIEKVSLSSDDILSTAKNIAILDVLLSVAQVSVKNNYVKPTVSDSSKILNIKEGRHPIVEKTGKELFVPNNTFLDDNEARTMIITGPNMAGKSVYMRQVALIVIMAQAGFFVPCESAEIPVIDRIFTRVGASDDLHTGRSTFMVEMSEVSYILNNITPDSLLLLDEVGRGTSTFDGMSIAKAIIEYISNNFKVKTLFSTHYHELTELEGVLSGIKNYKMTVREVGNSIVFVRKLLRGSANKSFGVEVAALAGLPEEIVKKAKVHLEELERHSIINKNSKLNINQMSIFNTTDSSKEIVDILREVKLDDITPRMAYDILSDLAEKANKD